MVNKNDIYSSVVCDFHKGSSFLVYKTSPITEDSQIDLPTGNVLCAYLCVCVCVWEGGGGGGGVTQERFSNFNAMQVTKWAKAHWAKTTTRLPARNNM